MSARTLIRITMAALIATMSHTLFAADTSIATMELSGNVPTVFSVTARGLPGDLDLTPNVIVNDRLIGILHFKYNVSVDSITMTTNTAGSPENSGGTAYDFDTAFTVSTSAGCATMTAADAVLNAAAAATDYSTAASNALTTGVIEDCNLTASWGGTTDALPLAGVYSMTITVTMVSL